jgi:hypothetical protein
MMGLGMSRARWPLMDSQRVRVLGAGNLAGLAGLMCRLMCFGVRRARCWSGAGAEGRGGSARARGAICDYEWELRKF